LLQPFFFPNEPGHPDVDGSVYMAVVQCIAVFAPQNIAIAHSFQGTAQRTPVAGVFRGN
jgi:hypothetical protein